MQQFFVGRHGVAAQQVFDVEFAQILYVYPALGNVDQIGQGAYMQLQVQLLDLLDDFGATRAAYRGQGQQQVGDAVFLHQFLQLGRWVDAQAVECAAAQVRPVIDKSAHHHLAAGGQCFGHAFAGGARAVDQHLGQGLARQGAHVATAQPVARYQP
ncbi:hypothetical protein D3C80_1713100 [compost metagenome]